MSILKVENISKKFGNKNILKDISFECKTGDIFGIFGRNGCGKSTLLKILFNIIKADSINVSMDSIPFDIKKVIFENKIGYLPQHSFLPNMKVRDLIPMYFSEGDKQDKIFYAPNIHKITNQKTSTLSLGQLRYLEILLVSSLDHKFLMLDEPFSMIEPLYIEIIKDFLITLKEKKGIIITDHYYSDVLEITNRNIIIKNGLSHEIESENDLLSHEYLLSK